MDIDKNGEFDAEVCEKIPLNYTNQIQAYGALIVASFNLEIIQISDNLPTLFSLSSTDFLGHNLNEFLIVQQHQEIKKKISDKNIEDNIPLSLLLSTAEKTLSFTAFLHIREDYVIIELEPVEEDKSKGFTKLYQEIKYISALLKVTGSVDELAQTAAENLKRLSGFDRVMIYRFDDGWNGQVIAEALNTGMDNLKGYHFPSSDIPRQARQLYLKNPYRYIPDIKYKSAALIPETNTINNGATDLSSCNLRSVARVHIEYLQNMGVNASMSVPVIKDNTLWGLVACHHNKPYFINYELRSAFELLSDIISELITSKETQLKLEKRIKLSTYLSRLIEKMNEKNDFFEGLTSEGNIFLNLLNLDGAALIYEDKYDTIGIVPERQFVENLIKWNKKKSEAGIYYTNQLPLEFEEAKSFAEIASGVIFLSLSSDNRYSIIGFRKEEIQTIQWAGNPDFSKTFSSNINELHPRNSFTSYLHQKRYISQKWDKTEIDIAQSLLKAVLEVILKAQIMRRLIAEEEVYKLSLVAQKTTNAVLTLNRSGRVEWANNAFSNLSGKDIQDIAGKTLQEILKSNENLEDISELLSKLVHNGEGFKRDIIIEQGEKNFYLNFNFSAVKGENNQFDKIVAIGTDFTTIQKKTEELQKVNQELDKYAYVVSHDLKAPLKGIEGLISLLRNDLNHCLTDENLDYLNLVNDSISKMNNFIDNILDKARQSQNKIEEVDLNILVNELKEWTVQPNSGINFHIQSNLPVIKTNKVSLLQVIGNLFSNAIKYGCKPQKECAIEFGIKETTQDSISFYVKDYGPGILKELQQKIFELFETGDIKKGTGVGLATTKGLIDDNGGRIWVESELGKGTVFNVEWKVA